MLETKLITELPSKFPAAVNLSEDFTQYGTNRWKKKPKGCAHRGGKKSRRWRGRYHCPFTDEEIFIPGPTFGNKEDAAEAAQQFAEVAWEEFVRKFSCYIKPKTHLLNKMKHQQGIIENSIPVIIHHDIEEEQKMLKKNVGILMQSSFQN